MAATSTTRPRLCGLSILAVLSSCTPSPPPEDLFLVDGTRDRPLPSAIDVDVVSDADYAACAEAEACRPRDRRDPSVAADVHWSDAASYCEWRGARLPLPHELQQVWDMVGVTRKEFIAEFLWSEWLASPDPERPLQRRPAAPVPSWSARIDDRDQYLPDRPWAHFRCAREVVVGTCRPGTPVICTALQP